MRRLYPTFVTRPLLLKLGAGLLFVAAWALLNAMVNLRYPGPLPEPPLWYLLPSIDITALLAIFALLGWLRRQLPLAATAVLATLVVFVRLYRIADGLIQLTYFRPIELTLDVPLLPELGRLLRSTVSTPKLILGVLLLLLGLALALALVGAALLYAQRYLAAGVKQRVVFLVLAVGLVPLYPLWPAQRDPLLHHGLYGHSVVPTLAGQVRLAAAASQIRLVKTAEIAGMQREFARMPAGMERLQGADVLFLLVESYGITVLRNPDYFARLQSTLDSFDTTLAPLGYGIASSTLDSCTYGGHSWLAHACLASGARIANARDFAILRQTEPLPLTLASLFERAGYRSVVVQPGTTRRFPEGEVRGFSGKYYAMDLDYHGPPFAWATMPDQYVLDYVHRREVAPAARKPVFIEYALVSSHAPWSDQPPLVDDWSELGNGQLFHKLPPRKYPVDWATMVLARDAYLDSLLYDLEMIKRYIAQEITRPALIIVLGDHQPAVLAAPDSSRTVPIHIIGRDKELVARFLEVGYVPGMIPRLGGTSPGMETFPSTLVERLSGPKN